MKRIARSRVLAPDEVWGFKTDDAKRLADLADG
jgi:hypothetical protein